MLKKAMSIVSWTEKAFGLNITFRNGMDPCVSRFIVLIDNMRSDLSICTIYNTSL